MRCWFCERDVLHTSRHIEGIDCLYCTFCGATKEVDRSSGTEMRCMPGREASVDEAVAYRVVSSVEPGKPRLVMCPPFIMFVNEADVLEHPEIF